MNDEIHTVQSKCEAIDIPNITEKESNSFVITPQLLEFVLLQLVTREDDDAARIVLSQCSLQKGAAEGPGTSSDQH